MKKSKKGFTIVELVIVIAVIAILAAVLIPTFGGVIDKANKSAAQQAAKNAYTSVLAEDLSDGKADITLADAQKIDSKITKLTPNSTNSDYSEFVYEKDGYVATYNGSSWTVAEKTK